jgi:hypothetical protein
MEWIDVKQVKLHMLIKEQNRILFANKKPTLLGLQQVGWVKV